MMGLIKSWSNQVVHAGIDDKESLAPILLVVEHTRNQRTGRTNDGASWFEQQMHLQGLKGENNCLGILFDAFCEIELDISLVGNTKSSAGIDISDVVSVASQLADQLGYPLHSGCKWFYRCNLRSNMHAHTGDLEMLAACRFAIESRRYANIHTKLVFTQAG